MSKPSHPADWDWVLRELTEVKRRLRDLERHRRVDDASRRESVVFDFPGTLNTTASDEWEPDVPVRLVSVVCRLKTAGTSSTVVTIYRNGVALSPTITLASGVKRAQAAYLTAFQPTQHYLTVAATTLGTGAAGLTVKARFNRWRPEGAST